MEELLFPWESFADPVTSPECRIGSRMPSLVLLILDSSYALASLLLVRCALAREAA